MQLRHSCEIHAIPADNQCQRKENHRNDRKYIHHAIQADIHLRLIGFTNLHTVIAQGAGMLSQSFHPIGTDAKMVQLLSGKQVVFILQQLLAYIAELLIILQQVANPVSDSGNSAELKFADYHSEHHYPAPQSNPRADRTPPYASSKGIQRTAKEYAQH